VDRQRINGFRRDGRSVCVRVKVKTSHVDIMVTAGKCEATAGVPRPPRPIESAILNRWTDCALSADFELGHLLGCLKQLERDVCEETHSKVTRNETRDAIETVAALRGCWP